MFDIGFTEILLIGVVALMVIGPEKLPDVARTVGRWVGKIQRFVAGVKSDIQSELDAGELKKILGDQEKQISELKEMVNDAKKDFEQNTSDVASTINHNMEEAKSSFESIDKPSASPNKES